MKTLSISYGQNVTVYTALREELQVNREVISSYAYTNVSGQLLSTQVQLESMCDM